MYEIRYEYEEKPIQFYSHIKIEDNDQHIKNFGK